MNQPVYFILMKAEHSLNRPNTPLLVVLVSDDFTKAIFTKSKAYNDILLKIPPSFKLWTLRDFLCVDKFQKQFAWRRYDFY